MVGGKNGCKHFSSDWRHFVEMAKKKLIESKISKIKNLVEVFVGKVGKRERERKNKLTFKNCLHHINFGFMQMQWPLNENSS